MFFSTAKRENMARLKRGKVGRLCCGYTALSASKQATRLLRLLIVAITASSHTRTWNQSADEHDASSIESIRSAIGEAFVDRSVRSRRKGRKREGLGSEEAIPRRLLV